MTSAVFLALVLIAGATQNGFQPGMSWPDINIPDIIATLPDIIANLPNIIGNLIPNLPDIIGNLIPNLPDIIGNLIPSLPDIIAILPDIIGNISDIIANLPEIIGSINWPDVIANLPGNLPEVVASIIEFIRNLADIIGNLDVDWPAIIDLIPDINISDIIDSLPDIIAQLPNIIANLPEIIANLPDIIGSIPEIIANLPQIDWPAIIDLLPEIERDPGVPAVIQQFPSLVQLECGFGSVWAQCCTASILNTGYVLTAAHCTYGKTFSPSIRRVRAGTTTSGQGGQVFPISHAVNHPSFGSNGHDGDIAVVRISGLFVYGSTIQRVGIVGQGVTFPAGLSVSHAGWGSTAQGRLVSSRDLFSINLIVIGEEVCCSRFAASIIPRTITNNMICVGRPNSGGRKADLRDAGAPVYFQGALVGVQSFGRYVGNGSIPVVASAVSSYSDWIVSTAV